ncbi:MAG: hypothetical protein ACRDL5_12775 [Solirubrobacteraceae bacterium]
MQSHDPGSVSGWTGQPAGAGLGDSRAPIVCPSTGYCLEECAVGVGLSGAECPGRTYDQGDVVIDDANSGYDTIAPSPLVNMWCATASLCFAADDSGNLYASTNPSDANATWPQVYSLLLPGSDRYDVIAGVACPTTTLCLASDASKLIAGLPPATADVVQADLLAALVPHGQARRTTRILRDHGYREPIHAAAPGRLTIQCYLRGTNIVVASGYVALRAPTARSVRIKLTTRGVHLLAANHTIRLTATGTYAPLVGAAISPSRTFSLARRNRR